MKAIRVASCGGAEVLRLEEVPPPSPGSGEVVMRVAAAGLNFIEVYQRTGLYPVPLPFTPGGEAAGEVIAVGAGVTSLQPGDRVASVAVQGAYAEQATLAEERAIKLPATVTDEMAAAAMLQGMTAHYLAHTTYPLKAGDSCLIHAAAGGVGLLLVQMAKRAAARVFATVSTEAKAELARQAGADVVMRYTHEDFSAVVKEKTGGRGVNVVYDSVGQSTFEKSLACLAPLGMLVLFGQSSGPVPPVNPRVFAAGSFFFTRPSLFHYVADRANLERRAGEVLGWVADGSLKLRIERRYPLAEAEAAHRALEGRETTGKVLLVP
ncbi:MAG TPA: quinone oxidoreductase [Vicinamibacteria bacterium]|nr:quinone oxidoreductase [Vicinamibacteria bacterium]